GLNNLPYGVFTGAGDLRPRLGVAVGDHVLDLAAALGESFRRSSLNGLLAAGPAVWASTRARITELLTDERQRAAVEPALVAADAVRMLLPFEVADYV